MPNSTVITLIAADLLPDHVPRAIAGLYAGAALSWLRAGHACDILVSDDNLAAVRHKVAAVLQDLPVDAIVQPAANRRKKLLLADMDSTIVTRETLDELAEHAGVGHYVAAITARAMNGEIEFEQALRERVLLLRNLPDSLLAAVWKKTVLTNGAITLVKTMKRHGAYAILISGGFSFFTRAVMTACGFDREVSNQLEIKDGVLTGQVIPPIVDKNTKHDVLHATCAERGITPADAVTVGDGANDIPMLEAAGLGIAYHAKPIVRAAILQQLNYSDLTGLLYAQGYSYNEFIH